MKIFYRISDNSYSKLKLPGTSKKQCLDNFLSIFPSTDVMFIADNCIESAKLVEPYHHVFTSIGNAGSLRYAIKLCQGLPDDELIYFVEDDYLHRRGSLEALLEGQDLSEYGTLYDHPDKYTSVYNGGETSKVVKTFSTHWRFTTSTCMTFFTKAKCLKRDFSLWSYYTDGEHPNDHVIFTELGKPIAVPIPGYACHTDLTFSGATKDMMIDEWAKTLAIKNLYCESFEGLLVNKTSWEKLLMLDALRQLQP